MRWIEKTRQERQEDVSKLWQRLEDESFDRFWLSSDQDGPNKQLMNIILPAGEDIYYRVTMVTAQLKAARLAAYSLGQNPGERIAITPSLLDRLAIVQEEVFKIDQNSDDGIGLEIVLNVSGLTHKIIDKTLGQFLDNGQIPLDTKRINSFDLVTGLIKARDEKRYSDFPI